MKFRKNYLLAVLFTVRSISWLSAQDELVEWGSTTGIDEDYGLIENNTSSSSYGSSGAISINLFDSGNDGLIRFPVVGTSDEYAIGAYPSNLEFNYSISKLSSAFAVEIRSNMSLYIYQSGKVQEVISGFKVGDDIEIRQQSGSLDIYQITGGRAYQVNRGSYSLPSSDSYNICCIIKNGGTQITNVRTSFLNMFRIEWESWTSNTISVAENQDLEKTSGSNVWNESAAYSSNRLGRGKDGLVSYEVHSITGERAIGLISDSVGLSYSSMDYACRFQSNKLLLYNNGHYTGSYSSLNIGDVVEIRRHNKEIVINVNHAKVKTYLNVDPSEEYQVQAAIKGVGLEVLSVKGDFIPISKIGRSYIRLVQADDPEHIPVTRVSQDDNLGFIYREIYSESGDLNVQVFDNTFQDVTSNVIFGPHTIVFGENRILANIDALATGEQYYLVVRDGMDRKWEMNFYIKN